MPKTKPGESKKGKNKTERTDSQLTVSPETRKPTTAIIRDSKHEGEPTVEIHEENIFEINVLKMILNEHTMFVNAVEQVI